MGILRIFVTSALLNFDLHLASIKTLYHKWKSPSARMCVRRGGPNEHSKLITVLINKAIVKNKAIILLGCIATGFSMLHLKDLAGAPTPRALE